MIAALLHGIAPRLNPDRAPSNAWTFALVTPGESASIHFSRDGARVAPGVRDAEYLLYGEYADLAALLDPEASDRLAAWDRIAMRPDYPFNNYLLSIFLNSFDLTLPDLDMMPRRMETTFPFPPRWPAAENPFLSAQYTPQPLPAYDADRLPALIADDHPEWVAMFNFAWRTAFANLRQPEPGSGFVANFIDPAFNANTFMWDTAFMTMFGRYGREVFPFIRSLDNFYAKQADDGFIPREINTYTGRGVFQPLDPRSTGPNILAWTEWQDFQHSGDRERLRTVFPALIAYHLWTREWRTHPDGSYWTSGWGSGMDNQTRVPRSEWHHRGYTWVDATAQAALSCRCLLWISHAIDDDRFVDDLGDEYDHLQHYITRHLWDDRTGFYHDRAPDGTLSPVKSIGAYWLLHAGVPDDHIRPFVAHLDDPAGFNRPHRVPTQAADSPAYNPRGGYWLGGVWSPTNAMVISGLTGMLRGELAHAIARNHVENVARVFTETGTLWENYAPDHPERGQPSGRDFVGWTGLSAITIPIENVIGIVPRRVTYTRHGNDNASSTKLFWRVRLTERHGVLRYPLRGGGTADLVCEARASADERPQVTVRSDRPVRVTVYFGPRQWMAVSPAP